MEKCNLCPNNCNAERDKTFGVCVTGDKLKIAKYYAHTFEEPIISGTNGSGTIFFCGCSLKCCFCQNFEVSRNLRGKEISVLDLANIFKELENQGVHNINLVNPTHYVDKIIKAFDVYRPKIPVVYNTHGYEKVETLEKINDYVDVYLPDLKYFDEKVSLRYSKKADYFINASKAILYMLNKKPVIKDGLMKQGVIIRHLALPQNTNDSLKILEWYKGIEDKAYLSLMAQYTPFGEIEDKKELQRKLTKREYDKLLSFVVNSDLKNVFVQELESSSEKYIPIWDF